MQHSHAGRYFGVTRVGGRRRIGYSSTMSSSSIASHELIRSIDAAATSREYVERARLFYSGAEVHLSDDFQRRHGVFCSALDRTTTIEHYLLSNVVIDVETMILLQDGYTIPETVYGVQPHQTRPKTDPTRLIKLTDEEDLIVPISNSYSGEFNWFTQCLPAIDYSLQRRRTRPARLILPRLEQWQEDTLAALGYREFPRIVLEKGKQYLLPHAEYCGFTNGQTGDSSPNESRP
jgi:hypothetical protein